MADVSRSERPLKEQQPIMFGRPLARAALFVGLAVGALGLALAVGASAAYLVIPSYDERSADERPPVVSDATQNRDGVPAARDARDAGAVTAPQAKQEERVEGVGRPPSSSASATPSASTTSSVSATPSASAAAVREAAVRDNDPPSGPSARSANGVGRPASATATSSVPATASASAAAASTSAAASASAAAVREAAARDNDPPSGPSARSADGAGKSASALATPSASATAPAKPPSTTGRSWWWRSGSGR